MASNKSFRAGTSGNVSLKSPKISLKKAYFGELIATCPALADFCAQLEVFLLPRVEVNLSNPLMSIVPYPGRPVVSGMDFKSISGQFLSQGARQRGRTLEKACFYLLGAFSKAPS